VTRTADIQTAVDVLLAGGVIAYPTESIPGLGCLPSNEAAVRRLLKIKQRADDKGLILLATQYEQLKTWCTPLEQDLVQRLMQKTDSPTTWLIPSGEKKHPLIQGAHAKLAVRITTHPTAIKLCNLLNQAIVSTSINRTGEPPVMRLDEIPPEMLDQLDLVLSGTEGTGKPSDIRDLLTNQKLR